MFRTLIAGVTALSLAFTSAAPAHASGISDEDVGKVLFGLVAAAALTAAIQSNRDKRRDRAVVEADAPVQRATPRYENYRPERTRRSRLLPGRCFEHLETRYGTQRMFGRRCLRANYRQADRIPRECGVRYYTNNGPRRGYDPLCLREHGYRIDRR